MGKKKRQKARQLAEAILAVVAAVCDGLRALPAWRYAALLGTTTLLGVLLLLPRVLDAALPWAELLAG